VRLKQEFDAQGVTDVRFVLFHMAEPEFAYKVQALITDPDIRLLQDTPEVDVYNQLSGERGDMYIYDASGALSFYLLARQEGYDFNEDSGYARFKAEVLATRP